MKITVYVKTNSRKNAVEISPNGEARVSVKAPPQEGQANEAVIQLLAEYYRVPKTCVRLVGGFKSKRKIIEVMSKV